MFMDNMVTFLCFNVGTIDLPTIEIAVITFRDIRSSLLLIYIAIPGPKLFTNR